MSDIVEVAKSLATLVSASLADSKCSKSARVTTLFYLAGLYEAVKPMDDGNAFFTSPTFTGDVEGLRSVRALARHIAKSDTDRTPNSVRADINRAQALFGQSTLKDDGSISAYRMALTFDAVKKYTALNGWLLTYASKRAVQCFKADAVVALEMFDEIAKVPESDSKEVSEILADYFPPKQSTSVSDSDDGAGQVVDKDASPEDVVYGQLEKLDKVSYKIAFKAVSLLSVADTKKLVARLNK